MNRSKGMAFGLDFVEELRQQYREDIDITKLAANLHIDAVVPADRLRGELILRFATMSDKTDVGYARRHPVTPV